MARSERLTIYLNNDTLLQLGAKEPLTDKATGLVTTTATVNGVLKDKAGATLGATISMPHVTEGLYSGTIADDHAGLVAGQTGTCEITADDGAGKKGFWELDFLVIKRRI